jgi:hypothetical protein
MSKKPPFKPLHCINPDCHSKGTSRMVAARGLCAACYRALARYIESGIITWEKAEERGICMRSIPHAARGRRFPELSGCTEVSVSMRQCRGAIADL